MAVCTFLAGLGLILASRVTELWQLYLAFGFITGTGFSVIYPGTMASAARWFTRRRGLALGIVASGIAIGTMVLIPLIERLIAATGWSMSYLIAGFAVWAIMVPVSFLMRREPSEGRHEESIKENTVPQASGTKGSPIAAGIGTTITSAARTRALWMIASFLFFFAFCIQLTMVHLVNYATDLGISSLIAATFVSIIGLSGFFGRILMGASSDRIGTNNAVLICGIALVAGFIVLLFTREVWAFYLFAVIFGFSYGGEVPQTPALVERYFGLKAVASLVGVAVAFAGLGGAFGAWLAGRIFDVTQSYQAAFTVAIAAGAILTVIALLLKKVSPLVRV
jgi:MFS family permease